VDKLDKFYILSLHNIPHTRDIRDIGRIFYARDTDIRDIPAFYDIGHTHIPVSYDIGHTHSLVSYDIGRTRSLVS